MSVFTLLNSTFSDISFTKNYVSFAELVFDAFIYLTLIANLIKSKASIHTYGSLLQTVEVNAIAAGDRACRLLSLRARHANSRTTVIVSSPRWRKMESKIESPWREVERCKPCCSPGLISWCRAAVQCVASSCNLIVLSILRVTHIEPFTEYICRSIDFRWPSSNYRKP